MKKWNLLGIAGTSASFVQTFYFLVMAALGVGFLVSRWPGASVDAWMNFAGALVGASLTVVGSVAVVEWQRRRQDRLERLFLRDTIRDGITSLEAVKEAFEKQRLFVADETADWHVERAVRVIGWLRRIIEIKPPDDLATLRAYDAISDVTDEMVDELRRQIEPIQNGVETALRLASFAGRPIHDHLKKAHDLLK